MTTAELIEKINHNFSKGEEIKAWTDYKMLLSKYQTEWKFQLVKRIVENAIESHLSVIFSINYCDLIVVDFHRDQVFFVCIAQQDYAYANNEAYVTWLEENRQDASEELGEELGVKIRVMLVISLDGKKSSKGAEYKNNDFIITHSNRFGFAKIAGGTSPVNKQTETYKETCEFWNFCAIEFGEHGFEAPMEKDNKPTKSSMTKEFKLSNYAPKTYVQFIEKNRKAIRGIEIDQLFQLSLHLVLLDIDRNILPDVVNEFRKSIVNITNNDSELDVYYINSASQSIESFKTALRDTKNSIVVIENLGVPVNSGVSAYTKNDQLNELSMHMEQNSDSIYILPLSQNTWSEFIALKPVLRILFQHSFTFDQVNVTMLKDHLWNLVKNSKFQISKEAWQLCLDFLQDSKNNLPSDAFTYTLVNVLFREACYYHTIRNSSNQVKDNMIKSSDIQEAIKDEYNPTKAENFDVVMADINKLTGLKNIKSSIHDLAALIQIDLKRNKNKKSTSTTLNALFTGNPGTGKTTVANLLGRVYKSIGALKNGHVVAVGRQDIVGQYIGNTEANMKSIIAKAKGGILFIDEAYSLYRPDSSRDYGKEAIDVLVENIERMREHTCVILAGYPKPMADFLKANPGLTSRFPHRIEFNDYSASELMNIFENFAKSEGLFLSDQAKPVMKELINTLEQQKDDHFGNARTCRNLYEKLKLIQARRIAYTQDINNKRLDLFTSRDIQMLAEEMIVVKPTPPQPKVGFK